jgi:hypothetical protein
MEIGTPPRAGAAGLPERASAPDYAEPLEAWRVWRVVERGGSLVLGSVVKPTVWPAGEPLLAECLARRPFGWWTWRRTTHPSPETACECGIYGTSLGQLGPYLGDPLPRDAVARVIGRVALWGTVVECERGYRGSRAYPLALFVPGEDEEHPSARPRDVARRLRSYRVPVEVLPGRGRDAPRLLEPAAAG